MDNINSWNAEALYMKKLTKLDWKVPNVSFFYNWALIRNILWVPAETDMEREIEKMLKMT